MVNTFLPDGDFEKSAQYLDNARLGKQRVEAMQLLHLLEDLEFLSKELNIAMPTELPKRTDKEDEWHVFILNIKRTYQSLNYRYAKIKPTNMKISKLDTELINKYSLTKDNYIKVPFDLMYKLKQAGSCIRIVNLGHCTHPLVKMWIGYNDSLKYYINCCIKEWIKRGKENNMFIYPLPEKFDRPPWTYNEKVHENHRAALITKEIDRKEKTWYINNPIFKSEIGKFIDYLWITGRENI